jgi:hypothetical protein
MSLSLPLCTKLAIIPSHIKICTRGLVMFHRRAKTMQTISILERTKELDDFIKQVENGTLASNTTHNLSYVTGKRVIKDRGAKRLANALKHKNFPNNVSINLRRQHITDKGAQLILNALQEANHANKGTKIGLNMNVHVDHDLRDEIGKLLGMVSQQDLSTPVMGFDSSTGSNSKLRPVFEGSF